MARTPSHRYEDPLDRIWTVTARHIGLTVRRTSDAFAYADGRGNLFIGTDETLDADDCLAQMIFHELCHTLIEGPECFEKNDFGLDNESARDESREHAALRLQAFLLRQWGLQKVLAPTTDFRPFYDALKTQPLADVSDATVRLARQGLYRVDRAPWTPHIRNALDATAQVVQIAAKFQSRRLPNTDLTSLYETPLEKHPTGLHRHLDAKESTCGDCRWQRPAGPGKKVPRCVAASGQRIDPTWSACLHFESTLDCQDCGACCRGAYQAVELSASETLVRSHPMLIQKEDGRLSLRRIDDHCAALEGDGSQSTPFSCAVYAKRPRTCRDFTQGETYCLDARRRLGLSI